MGKILSVPTLQTVIAQNPEVITFSLTEPPYGYLDWCPIDLNFNCSEAPWDNAQLRWAVSNAIDRTNLVALAESGAGVTALHQFTPYEWFTPFEETLQPIFEQYGLDNDPHPEKVEELMTGLGYTKNGDDMWELDGKTVEMTIFVPDWLKSLRTAIDAATSRCRFRCLLRHRPRAHYPALKPESRLLSFGCKGPAGVKGMDPYFMLSIYMSEYFRPDRRPRPDLVGHIALAERRL